MVQSSNDASVKDAQIMLDKEECAQNTEQTQRNAAAKDVQIMLKKEVFA